MLVARTLVGFILGNTGVMFAMLADITPKNRLPFAIGWISAGGTLGMSIGPFLGGWALSRLTISQLYLLDAIACWVVVVVLWLLLRETRSRPRPDASTLDLLRALPSNVWASRAVPPLFALYFVVFLGANLQMPFVPLLVAAVYEGPDLPLAIGGVMLAVGVLSAVAAPLLGALAQRFGPRRVLTTALIFGAGAGVAQAIAPDYGWLLAARAVYGLAQGGSAPLVVSMIAVAAPEDRRGSIHCSHRRASLFYGRNEESGLRCVYHGWKYDVDGDVLETPAEHPGSRLAQRVHHLAYPCQEASGVVFTYMGPKDKMPLFPAFDWITVPQSHVGVAKFYLESNYLQALEGDCDTSHSAYLHRGNNGEGLAPVVDGAPRFEIDRTWCGLRAAAIRQDEVHGSYVRVSTFAMPFIGSVARGTMINGKLDGFLAVYQVPLDDTHTWRYNFRFKRSEPMGERGMYADRKQAGPDFRLIANPSNEYLLDRDKQHTYNYTGIDGFATQDAAVTQSMGPITDRSREHLGGSDSYVIALRRFLLKAVKDFRRGIEPPGLVFDPAENDYSAARCTWTTLELGEHWKESEVKLYGALR